jgi:uncharacterized protein YkwD
MSRLLFFFTITLTLSACLNDLGPEQTSATVFSISGSVTGQSSDFRVSLSVNNAFVSSQIISANATKFSFNQSVAMNDQYAIAVSQPPSLQRCILSSEHQGTIVTDVSSITIECEDSTDQCRAYDPATQPTLYNECNDWLDSHNAVRHDLNNGNLPNSPAPAVPVSDLQWDPLLADVARNYAATCPDTHNANRSDDYEQFGGSGYVGENLAWGYSSIDSVLNGWAYEEEQYYQYAATGSDSTTGDAVGHYTQVIWRGTTHVGCAVLAGCSNWPTTYVCNYAPGGNYTGQKAY